MNIFDVLVYFALLAAIALGFKSGLLRSGVTILGYLIAMPLAVWIDQAVAPRIAATAPLASAQVSLTLFAIFLACGIVLAGLLRLAVNDLIGPQIGWGDRIGGAALGAVRVFLIAVTLVLIFDQLIPPNAQPPFLVGSQLRPMLSKAGQIGFKSLPPEAAAYIEDIKRTRRI